MTYLRVDVVRSARKHHNALAVLSCPLYSALTLLADALHIRSVCLKSALYGGLERHFAVEGMASDICHVEIKNVRAEAYCTNVRLLNQGGTKLHDILIDGVYDTSEGSAHMDRGLYAVRIGDTHMYGSRHATADETYNITVRNVRGRGEHVISLAGEITNLVMYGIESFDGAAMLLDKRGIFE